MSAAGRLWRRAPAWRLCLISAIGASALAAMFPPPFLRHVSLSGSGGVTSAPVTGGSHFVLLPETPPVGQGMFSMPPFGPGRTGIMAFSGRQVLLPEGRWQVVQIARSGSDGFLQTSVLARVENDRLTGLLQLAAPDPLGHAIGPVTAPEPCFDPGAILVEAVPENPALSPTVHECLDIAASRTGRAASRGYIGIPLDAVLDRLDRLGIKYPGDLLAATFFRSDETGWMMGTFFVPDKRSVSPESEHHLEQWARRYKIAFHKGYASELTQADEEQKFIRDPEG